MAAWPSGRVVGRMVGRMVASVVASRADLRALRASWGSVRGGWAGARRDARELLRHRRLRVDTAAMTPGGMQVVLRTRLRLSGDTQTDILRGWIDSAAAEVVAATAQSHFQSVSAATGGWAAALGLQRLAIRLAILAGSLASAAATIPHLLAADPAVWPHLVLAQWWLLSGFAFALAAILARWLLRWRLRALFRGGLAPPNPAP